MSLPMSPMSLDMSLVSLTGLGREPKDGIIMRNVAQGALR